MQKITPFFWFEDKAEEAAKFYVSIFKNSKINSATKLDGAPGPEGKTVMVSFVLEGQDFLALNGGPGVFPSFTGAISFLVKCDMQEEIDRLWEKLSEGGKTQQCGWLTDKFGITWQIVPTVLEKLIGDKDRAKGKRVTEAMLKMKKFDIAALEEAHRGK